MGLNCILYFALAMFMIRFVANRFSFDFEIAAERDISKIILLLPARKRAKRLVLLVLFRALVLGCDESFVIWPCTRWHTTMSGLIPLSLCCACAHVICAQPTCGCAAATRTTALNPYCMNLEKDKGMSRRGSKTWGKPSRKSFAW